MEGILRTLKGCIISIAWYVLPIAVRTLLLTRRQNLLRQALYWNAPYYQHLGHGAFKNAEPILQLHVTHCLDILRQQLMCTVDVAVFGQVWYKADEGSTPAAFVDFNTNHKCRNYDAVRKWAEARQLPEDVAEDFLIPPREGQRVVNGVP